MTARALRAAVLAVAVAGPAAATTGTLVVHLPSEPVESAARLAEAADALAAYLDRRVPGLDLEVRLFRQWSDAHAQLAAGDALVLLSEASFLLDVPASAGLAPSHRFVRGGRETYRRLLVVQPSSGAARLADLAGKRLTVVEASGPSRAAFLSRAVFGGEIELAEWFADVAAVADDATAAASVLYGQTDAALVAEHNPLVRQNLGSQLRSVYESPPLSLPVVSVAEGRLGAAERRALDAALAGLADDEEGRRVAATLHVDALRPLDAEERRAVLGAPAAREKELEIAGAGRYRPVPEVAAPPSPDAVPLVLSVDLPDVPIATRSTSRQE